MFKIGDRVVVLEDDGRVRAGMVGTVRDESNVPYVDIDELRDRFVLSGTNLRLIKESTNTELEGLKEELIKKDKEIANLKGQITAFEKILRISARINK